MKEDSVRRQAKHLAQQFSIISNMKRRFIFFKYIVASMDCVLTFYERKFLMNNRDAIYIELGAGCNTIK